MEQLPTDMLDQIVDRLVDELHPRQIYLFGSQARGTAGRHSDIDLMVIIDEASSSSPNPTTAGYHCLWGIPAPVELVVITAEEMDQRARVKCSLPYTVLKKGKLLYAA